MTRVAQIGKKKRPSWRWWILAAIMLSFFIMLQLPAAWILARVLPNTPYLDNVSGNIWRGQGDWHYQNIQGVVSWQVRPWMFLLLRLSAEVDIKTGDTHLHGIVTHGSKRLQIDELNGRIERDTFQALMPGQWPSSPIIAKDISFVQQDMKGFSSVQGGLSWGGGLVSYPYQGRTERINLPPLLGVLSEDHDRLHLAMTNGQKERMGDLYFSSSSATQKEMMVDVQLTQRLLLNVAGYHGQAGLDTAVISTRQPLAAVGASQ